MSVVSVISASSSITMTLRRRGGIWTQTVVLVQAGAGHAEPLAGIGEQLQPPLQLRHQPAQHGQGIFSGGTEGAIAVAPVRGG